MLSMDESGDRTGMMKNVGLKYYIIVYSYNNDQNQICAIHHSSGHWLRRPT